MRIFLSFLQGKPGYPIPAYGFWEYYIKNGIEEANHEWIECSEVDWALGLVPQSKESLQQWKTMAWEKTIDYLKKAPVDLFLSYLYPHQVDKAAIAEIRKMGIPCVNFFCDNIREYTRIPEAFGAFDLNWVPEYEALPLYKNAGFRYIHLPMPMWVAPEYRALKEESIQQVTFIGSRDLQRQLLFEGVVQQEKLFFPLGIYGEGWLTKIPVASVAPAADYGLKEKLIAQGRFIAHQGLVAYARKIRQRGFSPDISPRLHIYLKGKPDFAEYIRLTRESFITLGVNRYPSFRYPLLKPPAYSRLRDIEAPMLGACYLTEWAEGLDKMYDIGKEIEVYRSPAELLEKAKLLFADKNKRTTMRQTARLRALEQHSIGRSLSTINLKLNG